MSSENQNQPDAAAIAREIRAQEAEEKKAKDAEAAKKAGQGCLIFIAVIVLIVVAITFWPSSGNSGSSQEVITLPNGTTITSSEAVVRCRDIIRAQLLSPSSASFPGPFSDRYTRPTRSGNVWRYIAHVDSQNAFGATLPSSWNCVLDGNTGEIRVTQR